MNEVSWFFPSYFFLSFSSLSCSSSHLGRPAPSKKNRKKFQPRLPLQGPPGAPAGGRAGPDAPRRRRVLLRSAAEARGVSGEREEEEEEEEENSSILSSSSLLFIESKTAIHSYHSCKKRRERKEYPLLSERKAARKRFFFCRGLGAEEGRGKKKRGTPRERERKNEEAVNAPFTFLLAASHPPSLQPPFRCRFPAPTFVTASSIAPAASPEPGTKQAKPTPDTQRAPIESPLCKACVGRETPKKRIKRHRERNRNALESHRRSAPL